MFRDNADGRVPSILLKRSMDIETELIMSRCLTSHGRENIMERGSLYWKKTVNDDMNYIKGNVTVMML